MSNENKFDILTLNTASLVAVGKSARDDEASQDVIFNRCLMPATI